MKNSELNLATLAEIFADEDKSRAFLESKRWPNGPVCPHCNCEKAYKLTAKPGSKRPVRKGVYKCSKCRKQFTVRVGTIFESSKVPLRKWLMAIHLMTSSKKGVSSHQIARECGITVKTAWFLTHRITEAMKQEPMVGMLGGKGKSLEADETYVGARRPRYRGTSKPGRGTVKTPVVALVERGGRVHSAPAKKADNKSIREGALKYASRDSRLLTDEHRSYTIVGREFAGGHEVVKHSQGEYVQLSRPDINTNTIESFFALLKRAHYGIHHHFSKGHLFRYCNERNFMWNHRKVTDGQRMVAAIEGAEGKRLYFREPIQNV
jgi:transposase-like protein